MRNTFKLIATALCALSVGAAYSQTAQSAATTAKAPTGMSFSYDAQHDQIIPSGVQLKPSATAAASVAPTTGTLEVTINIADVSHFVHATSYHCSLTAIGGELDTTNGVVSGGIDTAFGVAHWTGTGTLACTLKIPYSWAIIADPAATRGAILAFGVAAVAPNGAIQRTTLQVDGVEPIPPNGTTSAFSFNVTL